MCRLIINTKRRSREISLYRAPWIDSGLSSADNIRTAIAATICLEL